MEDKFLNLPNEIRRNHILQTLSLGELCSLCFVSKSWKTQIEQEASYMPQLVEWLSPLDQVIDINPSQRFKKYQEIISKVINLQSKKNFFIFMEKKTEKELFEKAIKTGDCELAHGLIKSGNVSVNAFIEGYPTNAAAYTKLYTFPAYNLLFYLWKNTDYYDLAKLLLLHGADPTLPNYNRTYYCNPVWTKTLEEEKAISVNYSSTECHSPSAMKILSLIYIYYAERCFQNEQTTEKAINYLKQSVELSTAVAQEYRAKVTQTKQGFAINYTDDQLTQVLSILSTSPSKTIQIQEPKQKDSCSIS